MAPAKKSTERKAHQSKDFKAFLIVLPLVAGNIDKAKEIVAALKSDKAL